MRFTAGNYRIVRQFSAGSGEGSGMLTGNWQKIPAHGGFLICDSTTIIVSYKKKLAGCYSPDLVAAAIHPQTGDSLRRWDGT